MAGERSEFDRRTVLKLGGAAGVAATAGCMGSSSSKSKSQGSPAERKNQDSNLVTEGRIGTGNTKMSYWAIKSHSHLDENKEFANTIKNEYYIPWAKNHKQYQIDYQLQPSYNQFQTKLVQATATGNAPAMSIADSVWVPSFYDKLTPVTDRIENTEDWFPFVKDVMVQDGEWLGVWENTDVRALYYRQDLLDQYGNGKAPETWDELISVGKKITENENMNGFMYNGGRWEGTTFDNLAYYWGQGGQILNNNRELVIQENNNQQKLQKVFEFLKRTVESGVTPKRVASIQDYNKLTQAAVNGETGMFLGGNWQIASIKQEVDNWERWKVAEIPQLSADMAATGSGGWTECVYTTDEKVVSAAKDFTTMFTDKDRMAEYCKTGGYLPTRPSIFDEYDYFKNDPYQQKFGELLNHSQARPGGPAYKTFSSEFQVAAGKVITGQSSPKKATNTLVNNVVSEHGG